MIMHVTSFRLTQLTELSWLHVSSGFFQKRNFSERQGTKVLSLDVYVTSSVHAEHSPFDQPSLVVGWPFYIAR